MVIDKLIAQLHSEDYRTRERAARQLGNSQMPQALAPLVEALYDPNRHVRKAIIEALGHLGDFRAIEPLLVLYNGDDNFEEEEDWDIAGSVWEVLVGFGVDASDELMKYENDLFAMRVAAELGDSRAFDPLMKVLRVDEKFHQRIDDKRRAIQGLGRLKDRRALDALILLVDSDTFSEDAIIALGNYDDERVISTLKTLIYRRYSQTNSKAAFYAGWALSRIGSKEALDVLIQYCHGKPIIYRTQILENLAKLDHIQVAKFFEEILQDPNDTNGWQVAINYFWERGRFPALEKIKVDVPPEPANAIEAFLARKLAKG